MHASASNTTNEDSAATSPFHSVFATTADEDAALQVVRHHLNTRFTQIRQILETRWLCTYVKAPITTDRGSSQENCFVGTDT